LFEKEKTPNTSLRNYAFKYNLVNIRSLKNEPLLRKKHIILNSNFIYIYIYIVVERVKCNYTIAIRDMNNFLILILISGLALAFISSPDASQQHLIT
jgi:hypothetical protein